MDKQDTATGTATRLAALVVSDDAPWRDACVRTLEAEGCLAGTSPDGMRALDLMHGGVYDVIICDDSRCDKMTPLEFVLNVRDVAAKTPLILLGGKGLDRFEQFWRHWGIYFAGPKEQVPARIAEGLAKARRASRRGKGRKRPKS